MYCLYYAPYGVNETDGGFLTGLAWQLMSGKTLYADVVYVRPPLPVWLRTLEIYLLPDHWAMLGERWVFYWKLALYSWLGAAVCLSGNKRWMLASFGFVLSAHCYPPTAWHTVDGILFGALSIWCWTRHSGKQSALFSGLFLVAMLLCKQSFYPMVLIWMVLITGSRPASKLRIVFAIAGALLGAICFFIYLAHFALLNRFLELSSGASSVVQAFEHGVLDYFRIKPILLIVSAVLLAPAGWWTLKKQKAQWAFRAWIIFLAVLAMSFCWSIGQRQEFTAPFAQTRLLFWLALLFGLWKYQTKRWPLNKLLPFAALLGLSWSASVSWGYNLPVLFALPWTYALLEISENLFERAFPARKTGYWPVWALLCLLAVFRWGYEFVYRDGARTEMSVHLGAIFPRLSGIYSSPETADLYRDLDRLSKLYGPKIKTLPAFPQANFLTNTAPPLPLDWVVEREMGAGRSFVETTAEAQRPIYLIEKTQTKQIEADAELSWTKAILSPSTRLEETHWFQVVR